MCRRFRLPVRLLIICSLVPALAHAQFGGLTKKIKNKVATTSPSPATSPTAAPAAPADCLHCVAKDMAITPDLVTRLITGLKAELAERDRQEQIHAQDGVGQLYAARDLTSHCDTLKIKDSLDQVNIVKRIQGGDMKAAQDMQSYAARFTDPPHTRCRMNAPPKETDQAFFNTLNTVQSRQDSVGAKAGGFSMIQFAAAIELVSVFALDFQPTSFSQRFTPTAMDAMEAHKAELKALLSREFNPGGAHKLSRHL